jgi:hypothetical protein
MLMSAVTIRHYQLSDQNDIFRIATDTAFFGEPVEVFLEDRRLYSDAITRYYTDHEAPYVWVADGPQGVIGFLLGCTDTTLHTKRWRALYLQ